MKSWKRCIASTTSIISGRRRFIRILRKAVFNSGERKRLYKEAKSFLKLRASRNKATKDMVAAKASAAEKTRRAEVAGD